MIFTQLSLFSLLAVFASSAVAAMGLGGGTVLLLYLSFFSALSQPQMQAVNQKIKVVKLQLSQVRTVNAPAGQ